MNLPEKAAAAGASVIVAMIIIGQFLVLISPYRCDFDAASEGGRAVYSVNTNFSVTYTAVSLDNGSNYDISEVIIHYDPEYPAAVSEKTLTDSIVYLKKELLKCGVSIRTCDTSELIDIMSTSLGAGAFDAAVVFVTGSFPDDIYDVADANCLLGRWLTGGGVMYWMNGAIGKHVSHRGDARPTVVGGYDAFFFGAAGVVNDSPGLPSERDPIPEGSLEDVLGVFYNRVEYGIKAGVLADCMSFSQEQDGFHAVTLTKFHGGNGMVVVFGGAMTRDLSPSAAKVISSGITYETLVNGYERGSVNGHASGALPLSTGGRTTVFVYIGIMQGLRSGTFLLP